MYAILMSGTTTASMQCGTRTFTVGSQYMDGAAPPYFPMGLSFCQFRQCEVYLLSYMKQLPGFRGNLAIYAIKFGML